MSNRVGQLSGKTVGSGEDESTDVIEIDDSQVGDGATLSGIVTRASSSYDVNLLWLDENGNTVVTESQSSGNSAGATVTFDVGARSTKCKVQVSDESSTGSSGSGDADVSAMLG